MSVVDREALLEKLGDEIDAATQKIKVIAMRCSADGIALSELRAERERLERHRSSLLRNRRKEGEGE
jgi:hypothetical protein